MTRWAVRHRQTDLNHSHDKITPSAFGKANAAIGCALLGATHLEATSNGDAATGGTPDDETFQLAGVGRVNKQTLWGNSFHGQ
ncbi:MAG: hypothetical protein HQL93_12260 [Magnetococcales bacterium]|nr:hypothetical protein [Magnetococcales bacterium]